MANLQNTDDGSEAHSKELDRFIEQASTQLQGASGEEDLRQRRGEPEHRRLRTILSKDRLEAHLEAVFPGTTLDDVLEVLRREGVVSGIQENTLSSALERADRTGRVVRDVLAAVGRPAVYAQRREISYPFLDALSDPKTGEPLHLGSGTLREVATLMDTERIDEVRGYGRPVVATAPGDVLMLVRGEERIELGVDVFGKEIQVVAAEAQNALMPGEGVTEEASGTLRAAHFGYVSVKGQRLSVVSPIWISPDRVEAYFVNPPQLGEPKSPSPENILELLKLRGVCFGTDEETVRAMSRDLRQGNLRESCVRVAAGRRPAQNRGDIGFAFEPLPPARFEAVVDAFRSLSLNGVLALPEQVQAVKAGQVVAEYTEDEARPGPGKDLFGETIPPPLSTGRRKGLEAGLNVTREVANGRVQYISEIYGYAGVWKNQLKVVSPLWVSQDWMAAHFVIVAQDGTRKGPSEAEIDALLERAHVSHGVDHDVIKRLCTEVPGEEIEEPRSILLAQGTPPEPGRDGAVELLFKQMPDPGRLLDSGNIDFRERDAVPQVEAGQLLARRTFPTPGEPGLDVRGRTIPSPRTSRGLLFAGTNVVVKEEEGEAGTVQLFYATSEGWPRVTRDTLAVMQRYRHAGDVNYQVGNIQMKGDVEIEGTVKARFSVEATGDVLINGAVERGARIVAGGNLIVRLGIIGADVEVGGSIFAMLIQDSKVQVGGDLMVRNYCQNSEIEVQGQATVQGDQGGRRQLCLLGGTLIAARAINTASIGSVYERETVAVVGVDPAVEDKLQKYSKGLSFCDVQTQRAMRTLETHIGPMSRTGEVVRAIQKAPSNQREFLRRQLKEISDKQKLKASLEYHLKELRTKRVKTAARARIRVFGTAFQKTRLQIGRAYELLDESVQSVAFQLDGKQARIVRVDLNSEAKRT